MTWKDAIKEAREINDHVGSCWIMGFPETCERCLSLARRLEKLCNKESNKEKQRG